ncbi:uncharacterized protein [Haliotis cracherodii]|uniref:uncharacterized protein n=1 Tax=Haliotis cracherodii TaxID=6455 RepID=UPI0039E8C938
MVSDARDQENKDKDNGGVGGARKQADTDNPTASDPSNHMENDKLMVSDARDQENKDKDNGGVGGARKQADKDNQDDKTGGDIKFEDILRLREIQKEMKTTTTALQEKVETKFKLPPGKLNGILDEVLKYLDQEQEAAATSEIKERSPPLLCVYVAGKIEKQLALDEGSVNKIITSLLKVQPAVSKWSIPFRLMNWWNGVR